MAGSGGGQGVKKDGGGIGAGLLLDDVKVKPARPYFELFRCGGAEGVRRAQQRLAVLLLVKVRQLGDARGLAHPVDSHHEDYGGHAGRWLLDRRGSGLPTASGILEY